MQKITKQYAMRHSFYELNKGIPLEKTEIETIIKENLELYPSPFNSQSARIVLLLGDAHEKLWDITKEKLISISPKERHDSIKEKITKFSQAYGSILYYMDKKVIDDLKQKYPLYAHNFDNWSYQANAILQFMIWTSLANAGIGANLQHYNPLIDEDVMKVFDISKEWELVAQMPFGGISDIPEAHKVEKIEQKFIIKEK